MKKIITSLLILIAFNGVAQTESKAPAFYIHNPDCENLIVYKTDFTQAMTIKCGKMVIYDSLEAIKTLVETSNRLSKRIYHLDSILDATVEMLSFFGDKPIEDKYVHAYWIANNKYQQAIGKPERRSPCQCPKCLAKYPWNYRKRFHLKD